MIKHLIEEKMQFQLIKELYANGSFLLHKFGFCPPFVNNNTKLDCQDFVYKLATTKNTQNGKTLRM